MTSATATSSASGKLLMASAWMRPITPQPMIPNRSFLVIRTLSFMFMLLLLPTKMGCYFRKEAVKGFNRIIYRTIYDQQKAWMSLFQHRLPGAHRLSTEEGIGVVTEHACFMVACQHAQTHQEGRTIHLALLS